jgi:hypothetical protein
MIGTQFQILANLALEKGILHLVVARVCYDRLSEALRYAESVSSHP